MSWKPPEKDGGSPVTKYLVEKCDKKRKTWNVVAEVDSQTLSHVVPKLIEDNAYLFRVIAVNEEGAGKPLETDHEVIPKKPAGIVATIGKGLSSC